MFSLPCNSLYLSLSTWQITFAMTWEKCPGGSESNCYNSWCKMYVTLMLFNSQAGVFQCFSFISAMLGGASVPFYGFMIVAQSFRFEYERPDRRQYNEAEAILVMILILGIFECCIGCGATASVNRMGICFFSCPPPQVSRIYYFSSRINATQYIYIFNWFVYFAS